MFLEDTINNFQENSELNRTQIHSQSVFMDIVKQNPFLHFVVSEIWATVTGITLYALFRIASYVTQWIGFRFPLSHSEPINFLELVLSWGAVLSASATFILITIYQLVILFVRLKKAANI